MAKPIYFLLGAIPVIAAILLAVPLITKNEIPVSASNSFDKIEIEYTKHQLKKISSTAIAMIIFSLVASAALSSFYFITKSPIDESDAKAKLIFLNSISF